MTRATVLATMFGIALTVAPAPAFAEGLVLNDISVEATEEGGSYTAEISVLNTGSETVTLPDSVRLADSSCTATVTNPAALGLRPTKLKLSFGGECFGDGQQVKVDLDDDGPLAPVAITRPSTDRTWLPFVAGLVAAALLATVALRAGQEKIKNVDSQRQKYNQPGDKERESREAAFSELKDRVNARVAGLKLAPLEWKPPFSSDPSSGTPKEPGAIEVTTYDWKSPVVGLEAGWSFKDSWAANLTVATTAFVALLNSADTLTAVLGDKHESALGLMTVAGLLSAVIVAVANTVAKLVGPDPATVTAGGLTVSTALVTAAAGLQIVVVGGTAFTLLTGFWWKALVCVVALVVLVVLVWYARNTLYAALERAEKVDKFEPVASVPADASDAWNATEDWHRKVVYDRIKVAYANYLTAAGAPVAQTVVQGYRTVGPEVADVVVQSRRASLI